MKMLKFLLQLIYTVDWSTFQHECATAHTELNWISVGDRTSFTWCKRKHGGTQRVMRTQRHNGFNTRPTID